MSYAYHNFRNLYPDKHGRQQAHNNWQMSQQLFNQAQNENINYQKDMLKYGFGDPDAKPEMQMTLSQYTPTELEANKYQMYGNQSMQNAFLNEQAAHMDRQADWYENQMASKNRSDEMAAGIKNREVDAQMAALAAGERMNQANNNSLTAIGDSLNAPALNSEQMPVPGINGFDSNGKKVWGTYFTG